MRSEFGGDMHFVCFDPEDANKNFRLESDRSAPKLDDFIQGQRYRIVPESEDECQVNLNTLFGQLLGYYRKCDSYSRGVTLPSLVRNT